VPDERIEKWKRWIDGSIKNNVLTMHLHRHAWRELAAVLEKNPGLPESYWWRDAELVAGVAGTRPHRGREVEDAERMVNSDPHPDLTALYVTPALPRERAMCVDGAI
jgi:hypothetical protein